LRDTGDPVAVAERIAEVCARSLGDALASVVLHGSLALGDYTPGLSDIDLLVVVDRPVLDSEIDSLTRAVASGRADADGKVDLRVVTRAAAAIPSRAPPMELYVRLEGSAPPEIESRCPGEPDLVVEFAICRDHGRRLLGAAPHEIIGQVPDEWLLMAGDAQLARWESLTDDAPHAVLMVLTACRIWRFAEEHAHCSKAAGGHWALARDPSLTAVSDALRRRAGEPVRIEPAEIGRLLRIVHTRIAAHPAARH